ncbi:MAG: riboflavin synthase [Deltaproteobacteria bacterium]|nr:riboflavin synthase [Deltaproteobacteria bacterium]
MFTGLVRDVGVVEAVSTLGQSAKIALRTVLTAELREGDSLAVNGVCLTVEAPRGDVAVAVAVAETLERTTLGRLRPGRRVHLEPAIKAGEPMGGHIVQGHVDGVGALVRRLDRGVSVELTYRCDAALMRYIVEKGSIAIDGVSLTVAEADVDTFRVATVPHTLAKTALGSQTEGDGVNIEVDVLAKYVEKLLGVEKKGGRITEEWLRRYGF